MVAIADTSFVVSLGNKTDRFHQLCTSAYLQQQTIYLPQSTLAEVGYMLTREIGNRAMADFLRRLPQMKYRVVALEAEDLLRTAQILEQYADARLDFVDTSIVAIAERLNIERILTLDQRDFHIVRPRHCDFFELLPHTHN